MRIAVLMGGFSEEREVSLASGAQVARALRKAGHQAVAFDTARGVLGPDDEAAILEAGVRDPGPREGVADLLRSGDIQAFLQDPGMAGVEVIFPALHGGRGEDGTLQALLEVAGIPFAGSHWVGCALAMDKDLTKRLLRDAGVRTPKWITVGSGEEGQARLGEVEERLGLPLIVKPPSGGSTLGLSLVKDRGELAPALDLSLEFQDQVMFEQYVPGRELTVGIVGDDSLPPGEIIPAHELFDYECKYRPGLAEEVFPAEIPAEVASRVRSEALLAHQTLRLRDFSRVDFILDEEGNTWCLEANALPGLTGNSLLPKGARAAGIPFEDLCGRLAEMALARGGAGGMRI